MSRIVTFYSYKGGVGRTFALANVATLLAKRGKRVLVMDWDLEAPGLHRYFSTNLAYSHGPKLGLIHLLEQSLTNGAVNWQEFISTVAIPDHLPIDMITSGDQSEDYSACVQRFSWAGFFRDHRGGEVLDRWRSEWKNAYDFILIDSRTGITDSGGVCTVFLPDLLVLVFSANVQSFERGVQVAKGVQHARRNLDVPRPPVAILPLPGRFDGRDELAESEKWMERFSEELKPFYDDWLPVRFAPRQILEVTKVPYVTRFSFGEPLVTLSHSTSDPELPGFYLENVTRLLVSDFADVGAIITPGSDGIEALLSEFRALLARIPIDEGELTVSLDQIIKNTTDDSLKAKLFSDAGGALMRQGRFARAEDYLKNSITLAETSKEENANIILASQSALAELFKLTARISEAEEQYRRSLALLEENLDPDDPAAAAVYTKLAQLMSDSGRLSEAESLLLLSLDLFGKSGSTTESAKTHMALAEIYRQMYRLGDAEEMYVSAIDKFKQTNSSNEEANAYTRLGQLQIEQERLPEAETSYLTALRIYSRGQSATGVTSVQANLAELYLRLGKSDMAEEAYRAAISSAKRLGSPGPLIRLYMDLARVLQDGGRFSEAESTYKEVLLLLESRPRRVEGALAYARLAKLYHEIGELNKAYEAYRAAVGSASVKQHLTPDERASALTGYGEILQVMGEYKQAESVLREAIDIYDKSSTKDTPGKARAINTLARVLDEGGYRVEAHKLRDRAEYDAVVFYDYDDSMMVRRLVRELEGRSVRVWFDQEHLVLGASWSDEYRQVVERVDCIVVCIGSSKRGFIPTNIDTIKQRRSLRPLRLVPVLLSGSDISNMPAELRNIPYLDFRNNMKSEDVDLLAYAITRRATSR